MYDVVQGGELWFLICAASSALESASWGCQQAGPDFPYFNETNRPCQWTRDGWVRCRAHEAIADEVEKWEDRVFVKR